MAAPSTIYDTGVNPLASIISREEEEKGLEFSPQPASDETKLTIWKSQMLVPFQAFDKLL